jgi:hypothetical protein
VIDGQSVFAHEADRNSFPYLAAGVPGIVTFCPKLLQHQGRFANFEPTPAEAAFVDPFLGHPKAKTFDVKTE